MMKISKLYCKSREESLNSWPLWFEVYLLYSLNSLLNLGTGYVVDHAENCDVLEEDSVDRLWLVVRSLKNNQGVRFDYKVKKFDVLKLGRVKFRVKDFKCEFMGQTAEELYRQELKEAKPVITLQNTVNDLQNFQD